MTRPRANLRLIPPEPVHSCAPVQRGYAPVFRRGEVNHCPGCGRSQWWVGRILAECAFCSTAVPLAEGAHA